MGWTFVSSVPSSLAVLLYTRKCLGIISVDVLEYLLLRHGRQPNLLIHLKDFWDLIVIIHESRVWYSGRFVLLLHMTRNLVESFESIAFVNAGTVWLT